MERLRPTLRLAIAVLLMPLIGVARAAPSDDFRAGVDAFRRGEFEAALAHFMDARNGGMRAPTLHYNLGATYFQLGQLNESFDQFQLLSGYTEWAPLAHYNLGLVEEARGRPREAADHFRRAHSAGNDKLRALAAEKLGGAVSQIEAGWTGLVSLSAGYDDNAVLTDDLETTGADRRADYFGELRGVASNYWVGSLEKGMQTEFGAYYRAYSELDDFNFGVGHAGLNLSRLLENWYLQVGPRLNVELVGSERFATVGMLRAQALRPLGAWTLRLRNDVSYYEPSSEFDFLGGWQLRAGLDFTRRWLGTRFRTQYDFELNDRRDSSTGTEFLSYSPLRHRVGAEVRQDVADRWLIEGRIEYRWARYPDANRQVVNSVTSTAKRSDERLTAFTRLTFEAIASGDVFIDYAYADNDSSFSQYEYRSGQVSVGMDYRF